MLDGAGARSTRGRAAGPAPRRSTSAARSTTSACSCCWTASSTLAPRPAPRLRRARSSPTIPPSPASSSRSRPTWTRHRDRVAFIRIISGRFERDMTVTHSAPAGRCACPTRTSSSAATARRSTRPGRATSSASSDRTASASATRSARIPRSGTTRCRASRRNASPPAQPHPLQFQALPRGAGTVAAGGRGPGVRAARRRLARAAAGRGRPAAVRHRPLPTGERIRRALPDGASSTRSAAPCCCSATNGCCSTSKARTPASNSARCPSRNPAHSPIRPHHVGEPNRIPPVQGPDGGAYSPSKVRMVPLFIQIEIVIGIEIDRLAIPISISIPIFSTICVICTTSRPPRGFPRCGQNRALQAAPPAAPGTRIKQRTVHRIELRLRHAGYFLNI
jgi:hypothetical protein